MRTSCGAGVARILCLSSLIALASGANAQVADAQVQAPPANDMRFAVALQLSGSWCYGYLSASADKVRFEVVQPREDSQYSFEAPRTEVTLRQWILFGVPQDAIEVHAKGG